MATIRITLKIRKVEGSVPPEDLASDIGNALVGICDEGDQLESFGEEGEELWYEVKSCDVVVL